MTPARAASLLPLLALALTCTPAPPHAYTSPAASAQPPPAPSAPPRREAAVVTILYTSDEHGWLFPQGEGDKTRGGAAEALAQWVTDEGHCTPAAGPTSAPSATCKDPSTLLLSGGDNFTGPAVSSYFSGAPMAQAMARMGYVASAFGNHEYDFDRAAFDANRLASGAVYLAANVRSESTTTDPGLRASILVERRGLRIGVVGIATESTPRSALPSRFEGLVFEPPEPALDRAIADAYQQGADAVVAIAHACDDEMAPILERHPEWRLAFLGIGHCHRRVRKDIAGTAMLMPSWKLETYARVRLAIDPNRPARDRVTSVDAQLVDVRPRDGLSPDASLLALRDAAKSKLDADLGATIGFSATGMDDDSDAIGEWITRAMREQMRVDVAVTNKSGIRQSLPKGAITKATVYSILPFENTVYTLKVTGQVLDRLLGERAFFVSGARRVAVVNGAKAGKRSAHEVHLDDGTRVDPAKTYTIAITDFLYDIGKNFDFKSADPSPTRTNIDWRGPIIAWTARLATTEKAPLESKITGSTRPPPRKKKPSK